MYVVKPRNMTRIYKSFRCHGYSLSEKNFDLLTDFYPSHNFCNILQIHKKTTADNTMEKNTHYIVENKSIMMIVIKPENKLTTNVHKLFLQFSHDVFGTLYMHIR